MSYLIQHFLNQARRFIGDGHEAGRNELRPYICSAEAPNVVTNDGRNQSQNMRVNALIGSRTQRNQASLGGQSNGLGAISGA